MKRYSPLLIVAAAAAVFAMIWRSGDETPPEETWKPVEPS